MNEFAQFLAKKDFEVKYPIDKYEVYSLEKLDHFRREMCKTSSDPDGEFKKAIDGLVGCVVGHDTGKKIVFVRERKGNEQ